MNKRLEQFLAAENISQAQFADTIEVARASVSHVLAGRNKPGYDFIKSISDHYPKVNLEWLINGKGKMYKDASPAPSVIASAEPVQSFNDDLFSGQISDNKEIDEPLNSDKQKSTETTSSVQRKEESVNQRNIAKVIIFYDDNTYQELV